MRRNPRTDFRIEFEWAALIGTLTCGMAEPISAVQHVSAYHKLWLRRAARLSFFYPASECAGAHRCDESCPEKTGEEDDQ